MARVKKFQNPAGPINTEDENKDKTNTPQSTEPVKRPRYNIKTVYGDVDPEEAGFSQFMAERMGGFAGDDAVKRQFDYVNSLYKSGGLSEVTESGAGRGTSDPSLTDTKAARKQYLWGSNENFDRQRAATQYRNWVQEYAKQKYAPKPVTKKKLDLDFYSRTKAAAGGDEAYLGGALTHENRAKFGRQALEAMFKDVSEGDWSDEKYEGDSQMYSKLRGFNREELFKDYDTMVSNALKNDGKIDANEQASFISKYGINPSRLFGDVVKPQSEVEAETRASEKAESDRVSAQEKANADRLKKIAELQSRSGFGERLRFTGTDKDDVSNLKNYTLYDEDNKNPYDFYREYSDWDPYSNKEFTGYWLKGKHYGEAPVNPYQPKTPEYQDFINAMGTAKEDFNKRFAGSSNAAAKRTDSAAQNLYKQGFYNISSSFPDFQNAYKGSAEVLAIKGADGKTEYAVFTQDGELLKGKLVYVNGGIALDYLDKDGRTTRRKVLGRYVQKPSKEYTYDLPSSQIQGNTFKGTQQIQGGTTWQQAAASHKKGGTIDFNKIKKFQFGGTMYTSAVTNEQIANTNKNRQEELKRKATVGEIKDAAKTDRFELTGADKAELAALGLDLFGTGASFFGPLGSAIGAGAGVLGTASQFAADVKRDGFDMGDLGRGALGLGMDALSIIPGAKMFKTSKTLARVMPILRTALMGIGATTVGSQIGGVYDKFQKGGLSALDTNDLRTIASGLQLLAGGAHIASNKIGTTKANKQYGVTIDKEKVNFNSETEAIAFGKSKQAYDKAKADLETYKSKNPNAKEDDETLAALTKNVESAKAEALSNLKGGAKETVLEGKMETSRGGIGKTGDKFYNVGVKEGPAKITESSDRVIKDWNAKEGDNYKYTWLERLAARKQNWNTSSKFKWVNDNFATGLSVEGRVPQSGSVPVNTPKVRQTDPEVKATINNNQYPNGLGPFQMNRYPGQAGPFQMNTYPGQAGPMPNQIQGPLQALNPATPTVPSPYTKRSGVDEIVNKINQKRRETLALPEGRTKTTEPKKTSAETKPTTQGTDTYREHLAPAEKTGKPKSRAEELDEKSKKGNLKARKKNGPETNTLVVKESGKSNRGNTKYVGFSSQTSGRTVAQRSGKGKGIRKKQEGGLILKAQNGVKIPFRYEDEEVKIPFAPVSTNENLAAKFIKALDSSVMTKITSPYNYNNVRVSPISEQVPTNTTVATQPVLTTHENQGGPKETLGQQIGKGLQKALNPQVLKYMNVKQTNKRLMDEVNKLTPPTDYIAPTSTKLQNVGMSNAIGQLNQIDQQVSAQRPMYSDAKLNALTQLSANQNADQMRNQIWQNLDQQNQQIAAQNAQLSTQDAAARSEAAYKNAAAMKDFRDYKSRVKMGLISTEGKSKEMALDEWQKRREDSKNKLLDIEAQEKQKQIQDQYNKDVEALNSDIKVKISQSSNKNQTPEEYVRNLPANDPVRIKYEADMKNIKDKYDKVWTDYKKSVLKDQEGFLSFKSGGTLEEKKELEKYKAELKAESENYKAFNKIILEKIKSHEKMLSLLMKGK